MFLPQGPAPGTVDVDSDIDAVSDVVGDPTRVGAWSHRCGDAGWTDDGGTRIGQSSEAMLEPLHATSIATHRERTAALERAVESTGRSWRR